jgi:hypothetical protein
MVKKVSAEDRVREVRRKMRKKYSAEEKVRIVLEGLRGEESIAALVESGLIFSIPSSQYEAPYSHGFSHRRRQPHGPELCFRPNNGQHSTCRDSE